jgi:hypothetical protein
MTVPIDKPTKFHVSSQLESAAKSILHVQSEQRTQRGFLHRTAEIPVNVRLTDKSMWNNSTQFALGDLQSGLDELTRHAREWTSMVGHTLNKKKKYIGPLKGTVLLQKEVRKQKAEGTFSLDKHINSKLPEPVDRKKLRNRYSLEKLNKVVVDDHSGVWGENPVDGR